MKREINFGTDGIRGKANSFPFTKKPLLNLGNAISAWANKKYKRAKTLIACDTRISSPRIKNNLINSLLENNIVVYDAQVLPTPAVLEIISQKEFDFGIMISASHNHYSDNGIKIFDRKSSKLSKEDEISIEKLFLARTTDTLTSTKTCKILHNAKELYKNNIIKQFKPNILKGLKIVLDCANGATFKVAPEIFTKLGGMVTVLSNTPNGKNINNNCGALNTKNLQAAVILNKANIGFAFDGDGDRVITVNRDGEIKDGDDLLAILLEHPEFRKINTIIGTEMTNHGLNEFLKKINKTLIRTKVGDKYISAKLEEDNLILGGETSGHIIIRSYLSTGDGIFAALKTVESIIINNNYELKTFEKTPQILLNIPVSKKERLEENPYAEIIQEHIKRIQNGRILVRYSGTENLLRIMAEDKNIENAKLIANSLARTLQKSLSK